MVNKIPILNKSLYAFKCTKGVEVEYSADIIAENMWAQYDNGVRKSQLLEEFFKHKSDRIKSTIIPVVTPIFLHGLGLGLYTNLGLSFTDRIQVWASQMEE